MKEGERKERTVHECGVNVHQLLRYTVGDKKNRAKADDAKSDKMYFIIQFNFQKIPKIDETRREFVLFSLISKIFLRFP